MKPSETKRAARHLREGHDPGRYSRVSRRVWQDWRFKQLSQNARYLWLYLLTNPHQTRIPGLFPVRLSTIAEELEWMGEPLVGRSPLRLGEGCPPLLDPPMVELMDRRMLEADWRAGVVWLPKALKHDPPPNANVILAWPEVVTNLPECPLVAVALIGIRTKLEAVMAKPEPFLAAFDSVFSEGFLGGLGRQFPQRSPEPLPTPLPQGLGESIPSTQDPRPKIQETQTAAPADAGLVSASPPQQQFALDVEVAKPADLDAEVYAHWRSLFAPRAVELLDPERRKLIAKRRSERSKDGAGNPRDPAAVQRELLDSLSGWKNDPWVDRPRNARLDQLMGNAGDIDQGLKFFADGPPKPGSNGRRNRAPGGYASLEEIEAQNFTVDLPPESA